MSTVNELLQLIQQDIPEGRRNLQDSHINLEKVADYCNRNYQQSKDKRHALEETKSYTTQSLASVAYQINTLATNFLHMLDMQTTQLKELESNINHLSQTVMIHKEKVARREIGVLTTNKTTSRPQGVKSPGIIFPDQQERPIKYVRKAIDYSVLDDIGHGVKTPAANPVQRKSSKVSVKPAATGAGQAPTSKPPTPPSTQRIAGMGTLQRQTSSPYRATGPPVAPPSLPSNYSSMQQQQQQMMAERRSQQYAEGHGLERFSNYAESRQAMERFAERKSAAHIDMEPPRRISGYSGGPPGAPPMGMVQPMSHGAPPHMPSQPVMSQAMQRTSISSPPPPTPPPPPVMHSEHYVSEPPPPPMPNMPYHGNPGNASPPLPPPPEDYGDGYNDGSYPPSYHDVDHGNNWIPRNYLEKVVAIYDYVKDKDDELSFAEGSVIYVIKKNDDGWWEGVMNGETGLFPNNYVEPCI